MPTIKAVDKAGVVAATVAGVNIENVHFGVLADDECELSIGTLEDDIALLALFTHEIQVWLDGDIDPYFWGRPARRVANRRSDEDRITVRVAGLADHLRVLMGEIPRTNHVTSPHEDTGLIGGAPVQWTPFGTTSGDAAMVDNNGEFSPPKALQINGDTAGEDSGYEIVFTVPAAYDRVPFQPAAVVYIEDGVVDADPDTPPPWAGPAKDDYGLVMYRTDAAGNRISDIVNAPITDETPRQRPIRIQAPGVVLPLEGQKIVLRLHRVGAWAVWRFAGLFDGRVIDAHNIDLTAAADLLVQHAQDTAIGKVDRNIAVNTTASGVTVSLKWAWHRRHLILDLLRNLASAYEMRLTYTDTTRTLVLGPSIGTDRRAAITLTKAHLHEWAHSEEEEGSGNYVVRKGEGDGIAQDEWSATDAAALNGDHRELLTWGDVGESIGQLARNAEEELARVKDIVKTLRFRITGDLARQVRPYDLVDMDLQHGIVFTGDAKLMTVDYSPRQNAADVTVNPL